MSDLGYLSKKREERIAKFLDGLIDFDELFKNKKKILGIISIGSILERKDRKLFEYLIAYLDDNVLAKTMNEELKAKIENFYTLLENRDILGFTNYVAEELANVADLPFITGEKQIYTSVLMFTGGFISKILDKAKEISDKAVD